MLVNCMIMFSGRNGALICLILGLLCGLPKLQAQETLSADEVIQKAVARAQQAQRGTAQNAYTYNRVSVTEELDATGKVKEHSEKVYQVFFQSGLTRVKLLEVNGHPPGEADLRKQSNNELTVHQLLGQPRNPAGDNRESFLTPELVARFEFKLVGQGELNGRTAYRISFQPKTPEPPTRRVADKLLNRISGTLWIDTEEFEVARADIQLRSEVDILCGVVGCLKHLAYTMTRTRVMEGIWLNSFSSGDFEGRKLLESMRIKTKSQSTNFRPLAMNS
jgi:hypothetical protein